MPTDAQLTAAYEECGHLLAAKHVGRQIRGLWLNEESGCVVYDDGGKEVSVDDRLFTAIAGNVARVMHELGFCDFERIAETLLDGGSHDSRKILLCFGEMADQGQALTKSEALRVVAKKAERAQRLLLDHHDELDQLVQQALEGRLRPRARPEGSPVAVRDGKIIGYVRGHTYVQKDGSAADYRPGCLFALEDVSPPPIKELPLVAPFLAEVKPRPWRLRPRGWSQSKPKPKRKARLLRDAAGRLLGIERGDE